MPTSIIPTAVLLLSLYSIAQSRPSTSPNILSLPGARHPLTFSVVDFGATGDGFHYDTAPIQAAIDECHSSGGGRVAFPAGTYLTATVHLKSGVVLDIQVGATLLGGARRADYPAVAARWYVVVAENAADVGITGGGTINGQARKFVVRADPRKNVMVSWNTTGACYGDECRPRLVGFIDSRNVRVWNVNLTDPAYWCLHIVRCESTWIQDVSIYGDFNTPNNDGIDIEDSNNTVIQGCDINTGDDAICPKTSTGPLHNLTATNCRIRTKSSAIKLGSASWFDFTNLVFDSITIVDSHRGLAMQIRDGGNVRNVSFRNINMSIRYYDPSWWGRAEPVYLTTCRRDSKSSKAGGAISNVEFVNITAISENGVFLSGSNGGLLRDVRFENLNLSYRRRTKYPGGLADYRPGCQGMVKRSGTAGMVVEGVQGLEVRDVNMRWFGDGGVGIGSSWNNPLDFKPSTVNNVSLFNFHSGL